MSRCSVLLSPLFAVDPDPRSLHHAFSSSVGVITFSLYGFRKDLYEDWAVLCRCKKPALPYDLPSGGSADEDVRPRALTAFTSKASSPHTSQIGGGKPRLVVAPATGQSNRISVGSPRQSLVVQAQPPASSSGRAAELELRTLSPKSSDGAPLLSPTSAGTSTQSRFEVQMPPVGSGLTSPSSNQPLRTAPSF